MPTYKFFEVAKTSEAGTPKEPQFAPFNLSFSNERSQSRKKKGKPEDDGANESQTYTFKAKAMPDFSDRFNGVKPPSPKKLTSIANMNLSTLSRGEEK